MLDTETKRRIDACRDILVGKVPDPKSQVEQITIALIYKFMDDMDAEAVELGGRPSFFAGDFAEYGWGKILAPGQGGQQMLNRYAEGMARMNENLGVPALFRDIFRNAYLPYRDPETLRAFLKEINYFRYDHSERLGDAFEYLLSVLGAQGDVGSFRTPRHLIEFVVRVMDPRLHERILDPACGTAGFLISAYKHILAAHRDAQGKSRLTSDERRTLVSSIQGYDISPDMVRLSLVNLYLHGFPQPKVEEYDTLTSEAHWNETFDLILANPPFMSPKGGIRPHKRFGLTSNRSEVLFVNYIAGHLRPRGRAAIIVPEGVIFQSGTAYRALRKQLVQDSLVAVVSLPAGVFQPYSGVKTSVLILDKGLSKPTGEVLFVRIQHDGYTLGAQRRETPGSELPAAEAQLRTWLNYLRDGHADPAALAALHRVPKSRLAESGDWNLSGERYRNDAGRESIWPMVKLGEVCTIERGASPRPIQDYITTAPDGVNWIKIGDAEVGAKYITNIKEKVSPEGARKSRYVKPGDFILSNSMSFGHPYIMATHGCIHDGWLLLRDYFEQLDPDYLYAILGSAPVVEQFKLAATGGVANNLNSQLVREVEIPLPPLPVQQELVAEIAGYQRVLDGAQQVLAAYQPRIAVDAGWPVMELGGIFKTRSGTTPSRDQDAYFTGGTIPWVKTLDLTDAHIWGTDESITELALQRTSLQILPKGTVLVAMYGGFNQIGRTSVLEIEATHNQAMTALLPNPEVDPYFLNYSLVSSKDYWGKVANSTRKDANITKSDVLNFKLSLPDLATQRAIVAEIEAEQRLVAANRELIIRMEARIRAAIGRVWGAAVPAPAAAEVAAVAELVPA